LKIALVDGPVPIGIPCFYEIFFAEADGYIKYPANPDQIYGGHAICAVGYNDRSQLVKFKNSWGRGWGSNGYGYLPYSYVRDFLWDAWASKDLSVTKEMLKGTRELV
jgi:C1A family cysteine protease